MGAEANLADTGSSLLHAQAGVDVIVRLHDITAAPELDRALFSLFNQTYPFVRPIIVAQGFDQSAIAELERQVSRYNWARRGLEPSIVSVDNPEGGDLRSRLLNFGLNAGTGRYFAVLDADDYLYGTALEWLVSGLGGGSFAIAFGDIVIKNVALSRGVQFVYGRSGGVYRGSGLKDLLIENFCPIHSFVVDRTMVDRKDLYFNESISRLEDYDFLIRICSNYPANFATRSRAVGVYNWKSDGSNSTVLGSETREELVIKQQPWEQARAVLELTKIDAYRRLGWSR